MPEQQQLEEQEIDEEVSKDDDMDDHEQQDNTTNEVISELDKNTTIDQQSEGNGEKENTEEL